MAVPVTPLTFAWWAAEADDTPERLSRQRPHGDTNEHGHELAPDDGEAALVAQIRAGNRDVFDALYLERYALLHRLVRRWGDSAEAADELVQEVFVELWLRRAQWRVHTSITAYLVGAIRNKLRRRMRDHAMMDRVADVWDALELRPATSQPLPSPDAMVEQHELIAAVARAVTTLPPRQRMAALLHWQDGLTSREIAEVMEISDRMARKLIATGLAKLRAALEAVR